MSAKAIPLKQWIYEEAARAGIGYSGIWNRWRRGEYPTLQVRRVNARVVLVLNPEEAHAATTRTYVQPHPTAMHRIPAEIAMT